MRNLHVIASVDPATGGPVEGLIQLGKVIVSLGHEVEVACLDDPGSPWLAEFPFPVHALGPPKSSYRYSPRLVPWLRENVGRFDAVIVDGLWQYNSYAVWKVLRGRKPPYFVFTHGMLDPWFNKAYPLKKLKKNLFWRFGMYGVLRDATAVLFTCEEEKLLARTSFRPYRVNEVVVKFGSPGPTEPLGPQKQEFYAKFPELKDKRILLYLSRIHEKKGCDLLIESFASVAKSDESLVLVMAGPDKTGQIPILQQLASRLGIADRVLWPGMLSGPFKWGAFAAAEAFVLSSHQENFGIVVAEALACGTPVLISNKVNIWREVEADGGGIVDDDTLEGTRRTLCAWVAKPADERTAMRETARACFEKNFEITAAAESLLAAIRLHGGVK